MNIQLVRATLEDAETIWRMQIESFAELLRIYQDFDTNPGNESLERVARRLAQESTYYYFIQCDGQNVGAIRVVDQQDGSSRKRIAPLFVLPAHRNQGVAQRAMTLAEEIHGAAHWMLDTVLQEKGNCHLYEKMGYRQTGKTEVINERMTLVFYEKD